MREAGSWMFVLPWELHHPGGVNQVVQNLFDANVQVLRGRSLLLIKSWSAHHAHVAEVDGRRTWYARCRSPWDSARPTRNALGFLAGLPRALINFRHLLRAERVTRVNVHYPDLDAMIWIALRVLPASPQLVLSFHGADLTAAVASRGVARRLWTKLVHAADEIVVCSEQLRSGLEQAFGKLRSVRVIDNGVDPERLVQKAAPSPPSQPPASYLLTLATFEEKKGLDVALRAFGVLAEKHSSFYYVLAGRVNDADYFERIEQQRNNMTHGERVQLLPNLPHEEAMRLLQRAAALVLPSRREPFGIVVLEAGALARPVVATSACGVARRLQADTDLLVVPPDDPAALAAALDRLLDDGALGKRLSSALRQRVCSDFTWARIVQQYSPPPAAQ